MTEYSKTQLTPDKQFEHHVYHRDQFAHYLRWSHVLREIRPRSSVLDFGCGSGELLEVLYHNRHVPNRYLGLDIRHKTILLNCEKYSKLPWAKFKTVDLCSAHQIKHGQFDFVCCFEVFEHVGKENGHTFLNNLSLQMDDNTTLFFSTPCYDGVNFAQHHVVDGQIGEYTFDKCKKLLGDYFVVKNVWGTFASQKDYYTKLTSSERDLWQKLERYYDTNLISVLFAPLVPQYSRNCLWELQLK